MLVPNRTRTSLPGRFLLLCAGLLCAGLHASAQRMAPPPPPPQIATSMSADTVRGIDLYKRGDIDEAIKVLKKASKQTPPEVEAFQYLGLAYQQKGDERNARRAFETVVYLRVSQLSQRMPRVVKIPVTPQLKEELERYRAEQARRYQAALEAIEAYVQLNPRDAALWREQAETLKFYSEHADKHDGTEDIYTPDELTTKAVILSKPEPQYTEEARRSRTGGRITLRLVLAADGRVKHILVVRPLPDGLTETAIAAARQIVFQPATKDGRPVSQIVNVEYGYAIF